MWRRAMAASRSWFPETILEHSADKEIPSPRGLPLIGTTLDLIAAGSAPKLHEYVDARHRQLGPVYKESIGPVSAVFVSDPMEMRRVFALEGKYPVHLLPESWLLYNKLYGCKRGLFFMDGEEWSSFRRILNQLLLKPNSVDHFLAPCEQGALNLVQRWRSDTVREVNNLEQDLYRWSIDVMVAVLMGSQYAARDPALDDAITKFSSEVQCVFEESAKLSLIPAKLAAAMRLSTWKNFVSVVDEALDTANNLVKEMMPDCEHGNGLLGSLVGEGLAPDDVSRIVADLILAAGDTTAYSMQWVLYLLAKHPEYQEELYQELETIDSHKDVTRLPLLKGMIREALRLYPVAPFLTRCLPHGCEIRGYDVPAGQLIILSIYTSGHNENYFPDAARFWPERWNRDGSSGYMGVTTPHASLPFAMGARSCIGRKIAETQMTLTLAKIVQQFRIKLQNSNDIKMILRLVAVPSEPIKLQLIQR